MKRITATRNHVNGKELRSETIKGYQFKYKRDEFSLDLIVYCVPGRRKFWDVLHIDTGANFGTFSKTKEEAIEKVLILLNRESVDSISAAINSFRIRIEKLLKV